MAEIKSTLEIVMEKTKGLRMSESDKEKLREEALSQKAKGLCSRYLEGQIDWEALVTDLRGRDERDRSLIKRAVYHHLVESLDISSYNDLASRAIEALANGRAKEILKKVHDLTTSYFKGRQKKQKKIRPDIWAKLAKKGISGSAVEPNVNDSPEWKQMEKQLIRQYREKLGELKQRLTETFDPS